MLEHKITIQTAQYANEEHTAAVVFTKEAGAVAISEADTPGWWKQFKSWEKKRKPTPHKDVK